MGEQGKFTPDKETFAARDSLRQNIGQLLDQRYGISLDRVLKRGREVTVKLSYYDMDDPELPEPLVQFVQERFHGRSYGITTIEVGYNLHEIREGQKAIGTEPHGYIDVSVSHMYPSSEEEAVLERQRVVIGTDEVTGLPETEGITRLESEEDFGYVILPNVNLVVHPHVSLFPFETPMEWRMSGHTLDVWLADRAEMLRQKAAKERLQDLLSADRQVIDPYNLGIISDKPHRSLRLADIYHAPLQPNLVQVIANLLPDLPENRAYLTRDGMSDPTRERIPEPRKEITIR